MFQPLELFLAIRHSRSRRSGSFAHFINWVSTLGILLGVTALIVVSSVMNGFENDLKERVLGVVPQVSIVPSSETTSIEQWKNVLQQLHLPSQVIAAAPYVNADGVLQHEGVLKPVLLYGMDPTYEPQDSLLKQRMVVGHLNHLEMKPYGIVLSRSMARSLGVHMGSTVRIMAAQGQSYTPLGVIPAQRKFHVVGLFDTGTVIDQQVVFLHQKDAAKLFRLPPEQKTGIRLYLQDAFQAEQVAHYLQAQLAQPALPVTIEYWGNRYGQLFAAVKMEKTMMFIMLSLIIAIAAFNSISALSMLVVDKRQDIAVLQTYGMSRIRVYRIFMLQGLYSGVIGTGIGVLFGGVITWYINPILTFLGVTLMDAGQSLPFEIRISQVVIIGLFSMTLSFLATLYPARKAASIEPAEALRYE